MLTALSRGAGAGRGSFFAAGRLAGGAGGLGLACLAGGGAAVVPLSWEGWWVSLTVEVDVVEANGGWGIGRAATGGCGGGGGREEHSVK